MLQTKKSKIILFSALGVAAVALVGGALLFGGGKTEPSVEAQSFTYTSVKEGSIASSTLLSGTVAAADEQYVYYDVSKGDLNAVLVSPGDQVQVGTPLVQYDTGELQAAYDTAVRARNKVGRQIEDLRTNGQTVDLTGDDAVDNKSTANAQRTVDMQMQDLNDAYADAQAAVDKAQSALNEATVTSNVVGTVVEVNKSVSKSNTSTSQTIVHIVNQGSLQVTGELSEYDLANISAEQEVKITSKVYPDKVWTGKISYISNYPEKGQASTGLSGSGSGTASSKYPFKVAITSEVGELKQGFSVNIEVVNNSKAILVPVGAVVSEDDKRFVWTITDGKAKKVEVTLGNSDAMYQEVTGGLKVDDQVISNPNDSLQDGKEVEANEETTHQANQDQ
ncbi:efflux transporter periplasmic adaptor subunit [Streptococcus azizii]|uniref:Efflux transporter periplasmic adaptor subunit n=1 Tax=Streptococcus azizii TaxID=1579424 RepID=A0AB36JS53_9STRE|nr:MULTISPECIES: efflux RND transporter periplasmic adaptor subunit [Streptococcus]MBF0775748.1 efflux RND transporter periplasmic adaptor subunit [Streptococcus sp. 19428wD3_AN2]ONK29156.1 efflux transporter periplasmic adaptor subunit [Streptococcus azizii]ONK29702.1 efflux transporter periplasmic adaptor subunit [Streptococcus azizii]ONK30639.1 efflux transporter periplasmic adaptor subunit [Streptococcus azizii]TFU84040.1 efflux RND transporter periplasmic adaptor subunit [Streptococcus sp